MASLTAYTKDSEGNDIELEGESVEDLAKELAGYGDDSLHATVRDDHGCVRGWIHGDGNWKAQ